MQKSNTYTVCLTVAGSDSGGGAGIQADLKTFAALGCYGTSVIASLTAQNTCGVSGVFPVTPDFVEAQLQAVLTDIPPMAVKTGMLWSEGIITTCAEVFRSYKVSNLVVDPVMVATSGNPLLQPEAVEAYKKYLFPLADLITPNLAEARALVGEAPDAATLCRKLGDLGSKAVLLKGGHGDGDTLTDYLYLVEDNELYPISHLRLDTDNTHGTGCTLSSACAAFLARGHNPIIAVQNAVEWLQKALGTGAAYRLGTGHGPVHHFYEFWQ